MQKILFLVHNEYQMMLSLSLIADRFYNQEEYSINLYQIDTGDGKRFQFDKNIEIASHVEYKAIKYNNVVVYNSDLVEFITLILKSKFDIFIFFNHHVTLPVYLAKQLYKQGTKIYLAPDGLKVYNESRKITPRWTLHGAVNFNKFVRVNRLPFSYYFPTVTYANLKEITKVYVHFPESYKNYTQKIIERIDVLATKESKLLINKFFKFDLDKEIGFSKETIFYINQPVQDQKIYDFEIQLIKDLQNKFPEYKVIIKLHPLTDKIQISKFREFKNLKIITSTYPAELYIAKLFDSIVISLWSTACIIDNRNARIYWLYPILKAKNLMRNYIKIKNPTSHIIEVNSIESIV